MKGTLVSTTWLLLLVQGGPSPIVRVDSREQGRTFYVDTDRPKIREGLRDASAPSPAGNIPDWLPPYPGATPWGERGQNAPVDIGFAGFTTSAVPDEVFSYYESRVSATPGVKITYINKQPGRGGAMHAEDATRNTVVAVSPGPRGTSLSFNWQPKVIYPVPLAKSARLVAVWFDDSKGILRLRDPATGKEYDLSMTTMLSYARSVALEPSARTDFPAWLAFYPGAKTIVANAPPAGWQPQGPADMRTFKIELMATASVAQVGAFYKQTFEQHGLTIASETKSETRFYALEARTTDRMHVVYLDVHAQPNGTKIVMMDHYSWPRP
jgi:hypothetical protein